MDDQGGLEEAVVPASAIPLEWDAFRDVQSHTGPIRPRTRIRDGDARSAGSRGRLRRASHHAVQGACPACSPREGESWLREAAFHIIHEHHTSTVPAARRSRSPRPALCGNHYPADSSKEGSHSSGHGGSLEDERRPATVCQIAPAWAYGASASRRRSEQRALRVLFTTPQPGRRREYLPVRHGRDVRRTSRHRRRNGSARTVAPTRVATEE
jgi:hypothetical protein